MREPFDEPAAGRPRDQRAGATHLLWPDEQCTVDQESVKNRDVEQNDLGLNRAIAHVTCPRLTVYRPAQGAHKHVAMLVLPGGGFMHLAIDKEGYDVARWLTELGVTAFVLKYHTGEIGPAVRAQITEAAQTGAEPPPGVREAEEAARAAVFPKAIADTLRAIRMIRANAAELDLDPSRIGVMGFSAGAYLAVAAGIQGEAGEPSPATDRLARPSSRPDFLCPIYPAVPPELEETTKALPPAFIVQAYDDFLPVEHSLRLYQALRQADVPAEMHLYVKGGHGFGLGVHGGPVASWTDRFADWLTVMFLS